MSENSGRPCEECGKAKACGRRLCSTCRVRAYRSNPVNAEKDRERSRRWKRLHLGQPGRPSDA